MGIIHTENLVKTFGNGQTKVKAIDGINLDINHGFYAVTGPSGSGKSTLLQLLGGLRIPDEGKIQVKDIDLSKFDEESLAIFRRRNIGFIFRQYNLMPVLNVYENIIFPLELDGRSADREYIHQITRLLGLEEKLTLFPKALSTGERQKVSIARALSTKPMVILADEPTGNLDKENSQTIMNLFERLNKQGMTIVMVTHDTSLAKYGTRVVRVEDGRIIEKGKEILK